MERYVGRCIQNSKHQEKNDQENTRLIYTKFEIFMSLMYRNLYET